MHITYKYQDGKKLKVLVNWFPLLLLQGIQYFIFLPNVFWKHPKQTWKI